MSRTSSSRREGGEGGEDRGSSFKRSDGLGSDEGGTARKRGTKERGMVHNGDKHAEKERAYTTHQSN